MNLAGSSPAGGTNTFNSVFISMKKIIRITESDLTNIVKRVIKENALKDSLVNMIILDGWESVAELVGGIDNLSKLLNINSPMDFLHLFDDLEQVQSEKEKNKTLFRYKPKHNLMIYNRKNNYVYISYHNIWVGLRDVFGLNNYEIQELTKEWLSEVYNLRGVTPYWIEFNKMPLLSEVYNFAGSSPAGGTKKYNFFYTSTYL